MQYNTKLKLTQVVHELQEGMFVFTNGDGDYDSDEFFFGTIIKVQGRDVHIKREDSEQGEGIDQSWMIKASEDNPATIMLFDVGRAPLQCARHLSFGHVFSFGAQLYIYLESLLNDMCLVRTLQQHAPTTLRMNEDDYVKIICKHPALMCSTRGCANEATSVLDNKIYCDKHFDEEGAEMCDECGRRTHHDNLFAVMEGEDDEHRVCPICFREQEESSRVVHNHSYKPMPKFIIGNSEDVSFSNKILAGVEEEVECPSGNPNTFASEVLKKFAKKNKWCYIKNDASLINGFELVTHPANLQGHYDLPWSDLSAYYKAKNIEADNTSTCGLHIHTNKNILDDAHQNRLAYFINSQRANMEIIARRPACQWAKYKRANHPIATLHKTSGDKYEALNWLPDHTVEFRMFKGTIDDHTLMATIEFVHAAIMFTHKYKLEELKHRETAWKDFMDFVGSSSYEHLPNYLRERGIQ